MVGKAHPVYHRQVRIQFKHKSFNVFKKEVKMKRMMVMIAAIIIVGTCCFADNYTHSAIRSEEPSETYYLDRKLKEQKEKNDPISAGLLARAGYAFNYDAFTYGVSFFYQWSRIAGITAGFDGYYIPTKLAYRTLQNDTVPTSAFSLPLWDIRAGFMITRYFLFGAMLGKTNIGDATNLINMRKDAWFVNNSESNFLFGGFITFVLPVSNHFGLNLDFAVTNKTGFNVSMGINASIPIK